MRRGQASMVGWLALVIACAPTTDAPTQPHRAASFDPTKLRSCEEAFRVWVSNAASLNSPGTDVIALAIVQESVQRRVFELCSLSEADRYNREIPLVIAPGITQPLIEPDFRTFAEVECVDEVPLLGGTRLCAEVGH